MNGAEKVTGEPLAMSMYSTMLLASFEEEQGEREVVDLLERLLECRRNLAGPPSGWGKSEPADDLALNIAHDHALMALCRARGVACDPRRFGRPAQERARLEHELAKTGISLPEIRSLG